MGACMPTTIEDRITYPMISENLSQNHYSGLRYEDLKPKSDEDKKVLHNICSYALQGNLLQLRAFFPDNVHLINMVCENLGTPLVLAANEGHLDVCQELIAQRADVQGYCGQGTTPLYHAAMQGHLHLVQYLLEQGAEIDLLNKVEDEDVTALHVAAHRGHLEVVKYLHERGADIHKRKLGGATPLWLAAQEGHLPVVQYLYNNQADANSPRDEPDCHTPVFIAAQKGHADVIDYLMRECGVSIGPCGENLLTPLHAAAMFARIQACEALCRNHPDEHRKDFVNSESMHGYTALELRETHNRDAAEGVFDVLRHYEADDRLAAKQHPKVIDSKDQKPKVMDHNPDVQQPGSYPQDQQAQQQEEAPPQEDAPPADEGQTAE